MALHNHPQALLGLAGFAQGALPAAGAACLLGAASAGSGRDFRLAAPTTGTIAQNNRVLHKPDANAPEVPFAGAIVRLHRMADGRCAWQGLSDAQGWYHARGLENGAAYYPIALDPARHYECVAAGPVVAEAAPP